MKNASEGTVTAVNIQRQPYWPFQDWRIISAVASSATGWAMSQLTTCAPSTPSTMVSWFTATKRPRKWAGAISAMYIGERFDAIPMATPPRMRHTTNQVKLGAQPVRADETANKAAETSSNFFRPNLSLSPPETTEPNRQPTSAQLLAQPLACWLARWKYFSKNGFAPPTTTQSYPNSNPPRAAASEIAQMYFRLNFCSTACMRVEAILTTG